jgi:hypothetical protein
VSCFGGQGAEFAAQAGGHVKSIRRSGQSAAKLWVGLGGKKSMQKLTEIEWLKFAMRMMR